jgi:hypothetical protein
MKIQWLETGKIRHPATAKNAAYRRFAGFG